METFTHFMLSFIAPDPHWAHTATGLWVIVGLLSFMTIEKIFSETEEGDEDEEEEKEHVRVFSCVSG